MVMTPADSNSVPVARRARRGLDAASALRELEKLHAALRPGDPFPPHRDLIDRFDVSDRALRTALDELQRRGKIVRRVGRGGTYVSEAPPVAQPPSDQTTLPSRNVVALARPDFSFFDYALKVLFERAGAAGLTVSCHLLDSEGHELWAHRGEAANPLGYVVFHRDLLLALRLQSEGQRVVLVGIPPAGHAAGVPNIYTDHEQGGYLVARHLIELGHRRIAFQGEADPTASPRTRGHLRAIAEAERRGIIVEPTWVSGAEFEHWHATPSAARVLFDRPDRPTAIAAWNDYVAVCLLSMLSSLGLRVPADVSLVGFDNLPQSRHVYPPLTTVDGNLEQLLQAALTVLTHEPAAANPTIITLPTLVVRESTAPLSP